MAITMAELKKHTEVVKKKVDVLCNKAVVDGAVVANIEQLQTKGGSGSTGDVPKDDMTSGAFVDGAQKDVERALDSKGGSGASVGDKFLGVNQLEGNKYVQEGSGQKEVKKIGSGLEKGKSKSVSEKAKKAGVKAPKGGDMSKKTTTKKKA